MGGRTWVAVILCCAVWYAYVRWFGPPVESEPAAPISAESTGNSGTATPAATNADPFAVIPTGATTHRISGGRSEVEFSSHGGRIVRVLLNGYHRDRQSDSPRVAAVEPESTPFALAPLYSHGDLQNLSNKTFAAEQGDHFVRYTAAHSGVKAAYRYEVEEGSYLVKAAMRLEFADSKRRDWGYLLMPLGTTGVQYDAQDPFRSWDIVTYQNDSLTRKALEKIDAADQTVQGTVTWLALTNRYFAAALMNQSAINPDIVWVHRDKLIGAYARYPLVQPEGQKAIDLAFQFYLGAKEVPELSKIPALKKLVDYGMFSVVAYPLLQLLKLFYKLVHNYGVAIILLTVLVRAIFYPLQQASSRSMKAMQKLQPQINALKEKYKDDRERMSREQMALFKAHKVNPAGGCLPLLVQLPVFIALYAVLGNSIELFHAPFFGWVQDLSSKDPYYILPVLMGISMFVQQKIMPTAGLDPAQAKIMLIMPVVFSFMMVSLPSGLTLYIFVSTLLGVLQQILTMREGKGAPSPVPQRSA